MQTDIATSSLPEVQSAGWLVAASLCGEGARRRVLGSCGSLVYLAAFRIIREVTNLASFTIRNGGGSRRLQQPPWLIPAVSLLMQ